MITRISIDENEQSLPDAESFEDFQATDDSGAQLRVSITSPDVWTVERFEAKVNGWRLMGRVKRDEALFIAIASTLPDAERHSSHKLFLDAIEAVGVDGHE